MNRTVMTRLLYLLPIFLTSMAATAAPAEPEELRIEVYSSSALEIFWARWLIEDVAGYEVARDGEIVEVLLDGLSYFDAGLTAGQIYTYNITTINSLGLRSPTVTVAAVLPPVGGSLPEPSPPTDTDTDLALPVGLSSAEYSATLLELFWDRPTTPGLIYDVSRDGTLLGTTEGVSFLDAGYSAGSVGVYQVEAIAPDGRRSAAAELSIGATETPVPQPASVVAHRYSLMAAELIWDRPIEGTVMKTEVVRDGELLQIVRGNSYFDDRREPGVISVYELTAVNFNAQRSATTILTVAPY